jgi:hypothetical protein
MGEKEPFPDGNYLTGCDVLDTFFEIHKRIARKSFMMLKTLTWNGISES